MTYSIYIASKFHSRYRLRAIKKQLQSLGYVVLSKWMDPDVNLDPTTDQDSLGSNLEDSISEAGRDCLEIKNTNIFIIDTQDESGSGGRDVELGMALSLPCRCLRVGPIRNVFHAMLTPFKTWDEVIKFLKEEFPND